MKLKLCFPTRIFHKSVYLKFSSLAFPVLHKLFLILCLCLPQLLISCSVVIPVLLFYIVLSDDLLYHALFYGYTIRYDAESRGGISVTAEGKKQNNHNRD